MPTIKTPTESVTGPQVHVIPYCDVKPGVGTLSLHTLSNWYIKARKMRCDPTIAMVRQLTLAPALLVPWMYNSTDDAPEGAVDFIKKQIEPLRSYIVRQVMFGCIDFGWQPFEKIFEIDNDKSIVLSKIKPLLQDYTEILVDVSNGAYVGLRQTDQLTGGYVYIPVGQTFLHSFDVEGTYWYGKSVMENAEVAYDNWNTVNDSSNRYDTKVAGSHWVVHYPVGVSQRAGTETPNEQIALEILGTLRASGGIAVPKAMEQFINDLNDKTPNAWEIELIDAKGGSTDFINRMNYLDKLKVRAFGFPERSILEGQFGTKAEAEAHADFAISNILLRVNDLIVNLNWHLVNQLMRLNYGDQCDDSVYIESGSLGDENKTFLQSLYVGMMKNPEGFTAEYDNIDRENMRELLGVPTDNQTEEENGILNSI